MGCCFLFFSVFMSFVRLAFNLLSTRAGPAPLSRRNEDFEDIALEIDGIAESALLGDVRRIEAESSIVQSTKFESILDRIKFAYPSSVNFSYLTTSEDLVVLLTQLLLVEKVHLQVQNGLLKGLTSEEVGGPICWLLDFLAAAFPEVSEKKLDGALQNLFIPPAQKSVRALQNRSAEILRKIHRINPRALHNPFQAFNDLKKEPQESLDLSEISMDSITRKWSGLLEENRLMVSEIQNFYLANFLTIPEELLQKLKVSVFHIAISDRTCDANSDLFKSFCAGLHDLTTEEKKDLWILDKNLKDFCRNCNISSYKIDAETCIQRMRLGLGVDEVFELEAVSFLNIALFEVLSKLKPVNKGPVTIFLSQFESLVKSNFFSSKISSLTIFAPPLQDFPLTRTNLTDSRKNLFILEKVFLPIVDVEKRVLANFYKYLAEEKMKIPIFDRFAELCLKKRGEIQEKIDLIDSLILRHRKLLLTSNSILPSISLGVEDRPSPSDKAFWAKNRYNSLYLSAEGGL